jgi:hypothetical protein
MDIKETDNKCNLKCAFNFNYDVITVQAMLLNTFIQLKLEAPSIKPVKFNDIEYTPSELYIVHPSNTKYNGVTTDAEIYIVHTANLQKILIVCIPIAVASVTKPTVLDSVINQTAELQPKTGYVNLNIPNFSLEPFVPKGAFYFKETNSVYVISYGLDSALSLSTKTFDTLKQIVINPYKGDSYEGELFYNSQGSNLQVNGGADFGFFECDEYYETEIDQTDMNISPPIFVKLGANPIFIQYLWYFFYAVISVVIIYTYYSYSKLP